MAFRGNESPMDFSWSSARPTDPTSPFMMHTRKRKTDPKSIFSSLPYLTEEQGSYPTTFESPPKNNPLPSSTLNAKPSLFNSPSKGAPSPYRLPSFTTPRKAYDFDYSSGPESSPVAPTDNDETPDGKPLPALPKSKKRNSLFNFYGRWAPKSGKGEIIKTTVKSDGTAKRVHKKRRQAQSFEKQLARARRESEESESEAPTPSPRKRQKTEDVSWITSLFAFIHAYPDAPTIIAKYLQLFFNGTILFICLYMFYSFYATIRADVDRASNDEYQAILSEMAACTKNYIENRCESSHRAPALENVCSNWELCMNRDPNAVKRARLSAHTFAEIFNSFVEPISLKTMAFTTLFVGLALLINNATFTLYRRSQAHEQPYPQWQAGQHNNMGQFAITPGLPYQTPHQYGWQSDSPQKQLGYDDSPTRDRGKSRSPEKKRIGC